MKKNYQSFNKTIALIYLAVIISTSQFIQAQVTYTFSFTGSVQTFVVPSCVNTITLDVSGSQGGANAANTTTGGLGGSVYGVLTVTPGDVLNVYVGGMNGYNGGGLAGGYVNPNSTPTCATAFAGSGGGGSDIRLNGTALANRIIVGAGGGGGGGDRIQNCGRGTGGGGGGGYYGGGGGAGWPYTSTTLPTGGTQSAGGLAGTTTWSNTFNGFPGALWQGGDGGLEEYSTQLAGATALAGGSGGGLTGNAGQYSANWTGQSGAGGSSYISAAFTNTTMTGGVRSGNGVIYISYFTVGSQVTASSSNTMGICPGNSVTLSAGNVVTYTWNTGPQNTSISVSPNTTTSYTVVGANNLGCLSSAVLSVLVNTVPIITATTTPTFICVGGSANLSASGAATYSWDTGAQTATTSVNPNVTTTYTATGTTTAGCSNTTTITVNVNPLTLSVTPNSSICLGQTITLAASGATLYNWSIGSPFASINVSPNTTTVYNVTATDVKNCQHAGSVTITVNPNPPVSASANHSIICKGEPVTLTAMGATTYSWSNSFTTAVVTQTLTTDILFIFTVTGTANGCSSTATVSVKVNKCSGIHENTMDGNPHIFPNPSSGLFTISLEQVSYGDVITVYNVTGKLIKTIEADKISNEIDLSKEPDGVYFVSLMKKGHSASTTKIIKQ
jgi:hypothetical protein